MKEPFGADDVAIGDQATALSDSPGPLPEGGLAPGAMVSEYRVERELGRGGMGVVYAGTQPVIGKRVAIKVLSAQASSDPALGRRFVEEARAVNTIGHPNIIDIFAFGQLDDGRLYFVMEYLEGETLGDALEREALAAPELCRLLAQAADALEAAHGARIVHRDLKPENLWRARPRHGEPFLKVLDFGIAKLLSVPKEGGLTATGAVLGTPYYMAPEQCMGDSVDARADIYALGVILYRALTGRLPFTGESFAEIVSQQVMRAPARPSQLRAELSPELEALVLACLEKVPARRPQRAGDVAAALRSIASGSAIAPSAARSSKRRWLLAALVLLALGAAALVLALSARKPQRASQATGAALESEPQAPVERATKTPDPIAPAPPVAPPVSPTVDEAEAPPAAPLSPPEPRARPRSEDKPSRARSDGLIEENPF